MLVEIGARGQSRGRTREALPMTSNSPTAPDNAGVHIPPPVVFLAGLAGGYLVQWLWRRGRQGRGDADRGRTPAQAGAGHRHRPAAAGLRRDAVSPPSARLRTPPSPPSHSPSTGPTGSPATRCTSGWHCWSSALPSSATRCGPCSPSSRACGSSRTQVIAREEAYLEAKFGNDYRNFRSRVRRWL